MPQSWSLFKSNAPILNNTIELEQNQWENKMALDIEEYQHWFQAIRRNDDTAVKNILNEADE